MGNEKGNKGFLGKHAKSSAALVSLGIHVALIVVALSFVAVTVYVKDDQTFEVKPVKRPRMQLRKLTVPVNVKKKKTPKPKLRKNIVSKPKTKSVEIELPELTGVMGGIGGGDGAGLGGIGFNFEMNLFGKDKGSGNELEGLFFDLKMEPDRSPTDMKSLIGGMDSEKEKKQNERYREVLKNFANSWTISRLEKKYFKAPKNKFATSFMVPFMSAEEAPKAYAVDDVVEPKRWVAYYKGKIAAPATGRYRFRGIADDAMLVRIKKRLVIDASYSKNRYSDWESDHKDNRKFESGREQGVVIGDWFFLSKDKPTDMEVLIGEEPGGNFYCRLYIEHEDTQYPKGKSGQPILPIFKTVDVPEKLIPQMKVDPNFGTVDGPNFGVLK